MIPSGSNQIALEQALEILAQQLGKPVRVAVTLPDVYLMALAHIGIPNADAIAHPQISFVILEPPDSEA